jgi:predicted 3-demethylubiquinone-9 3-methyltransferase (glyoxalase superfamily)
MQKITPCIWFNGRVDEALSLYTGLFKDSKIKEISRYGEGGSGEPGTVLTAVFELNGQEFMILNGGPQFTPTEAVSFVIHCQDQAEIDYYWDSLTANGGQESMCGWLKDPFGVSWQIVPNEMGKLLQSKDPEKSKRVMAALMQMKKLDIAKLEAAYNG